MQSGFVVILGEGPVLDLVVMSRYELIVSIVRGDIGQNALNMCTNSHLGLAQDFYESPYPLPSILRPLNQRDPEIPPLPSTKST